MPNGNTPLMPNGVPVYRGPYNTPQQYAPMVPCAPEPMAPACPTQCVSIDPATIQQFIQALAASPPIIQQPAPRLESPPGGKTWWRYAIAVVPPNAATGDPAAIAGATALAAAESAARFQTINVLVLPSIMRSATLFQETQPDGQSLRCAKVGFRVHSSQRAIRFNVRKNNSPINDSQGADPNGSNQSAFELSDFADPENPAEFYGDLGPRETISVSVTNLDVNSGYLVEAWLWGWTYPGRFLGPGQGQSGQINRMVGPGALIQ